MRLKSQMNGGQLRSPMPSGTAAQVSRAFTLAEMLVVIAIIAIIATIAIPAMKGLMETNTMTTATRQLLDDVAFARQKAISSRSKVYMVFIPPEYWKDVIVSDFTPEGRRELTNLVNGQFTSYALFSEKSLGDQPGRLYPKYLTQWRTLPDGVLIETNKFSTNPIPEVIVDPYDTTRVFSVHSFARRDVQFPPAELTNGVPRTFNLPYIAFSPQGGIWRPDNGTDDEFIPLAKGSVFYPMKNGKPDFEVPDVVVNGYREADRTNFTLVRIDFLTGRARVERLELQ